MEISFRGPRGGDSDMSSSVKEDRRLRQSGVPLPLHRLRQVARHLAGVCYLRPGDIWLTSFPRSGSTWLRTILANLMRVAGGQHSGITPSELDSMMPTLGLSDLSRPWSQPCLPRFVKTHRPYVPFLFGRPRRSVVLVRDPRDALVSYYRLMIASTIQPYQGSLSEFLRDSRFGLPAYQRHFESWHARATSLVSYEGLRADPAQAVRETLAALGIDVSPTLIAGAIELSNRERMRAIAEAHGQRDPGRFVSNFQAYGKAAVGGWAEVFSTADRAYYEGFCRRHTVMPAYP